MSAVNSSTNDPRFDFNATSSLEDLISQQGKGPMTDTGMLHGDFWPDENPSRISWPPCTNGEATARQIGPHERSLSSTLDVATSPRDISSLFVPAA
jgi:hypothetical protein